MGDPANREVVDRMYAHLLGWQEETDDSLSVPHPLGGVDLYFQGYDGNRFPTFIDMIWFPERGHYIHRY